MLKVSSTCNSDMKRFLKNVFLYLACVGAILLAYFELGASVSKATYGVNTKQQILYSFENAKVRHYNKLFLGNSRVYRGINPDMIDENTYNFSHDNDSYNQCYYKLRQVLNWGHSIDTLFIGADYFQFSLKPSSRNYVYSPLLGEEYYKDYSDSYIGEVVSNYKQVFFNNQTLLFTSLARMASGEKSKGHIKENGQYIFDSKASPNDRVQRNVEVLKFQQDYYDRIIALCHKNKIQVTVFTMPVRDNELSSYTKEDIARIQKVITAPLSNQDSYIDMTFDDDFRNYTDYTDITHLNSEAANRFTCHFYSIVNTRK